MSGRNTGQRQGAARQRILAAAARLFYAQGMAATGVDAVAAEAGVARMSLYNNFSSKDELVAVYIQARHEEWLDLHRVRFGEARSAAERVLAVFDAYIDHACQAYEHGFRGCGLLNAAAELPVGAEGRDAVRRHKEQVEQFLAQGLTELGASDPTGMAQHLSFLLEGAMSRAGLEGAPDRIVAARQIAASMVEAV